MSSTESGQGNRALLVIDIQNDFCSGGPLEVPEGEQVVEPANKLMPLFEVVIASQDWHPAGHSSFASSHPGRKALDTIEVAYGMQTLWPDHAVQGSKGADFHESLSTEHFQAVVRKGFRKDMDSYSAFLENDGKTSTGLAALLRERNVSHVFLVGLATDYCLGYSALDAIEFGFDVTIVTDAVRAIGEVDWEKFRKRGVRFCEVADIA